MWSGPTFTERHEIYPPEGFDPNTYANNVITFVADVDGGGRTGIVIGNTRGGFVFRQSAPTARP